MSRVPRVPPDTWRRASQIAVDEIAGRASRCDPVRPRTGGPAGNARLTAWTGLILLILFFVEGITLLDVHGLLAWHIAVGLLLIPPALLKTATTGWRIVRYYTQDAAYRRAGPPRPVMRALGPLVVVSTLLLLGTGILVGVDGQQSADVSLGTLPVSAMFLHQASFVAWLVVMTVHVLGRTMHAVHLVTDHGARTPGGTTRVIGLAIAGAAAVVLALLLTGPWVASWQFVSSHH